MQLMSSKADKMKSNSGLKHTNTHAQRFILIEIKDVQVEYFVCKHKDLRNTVGLKGVRYLDHVIVFTIEPF